MSTTAAAQAAQKITSRGAKTYLPWLALFLGASGAYVYATARSEGNAIDRARARFLEAKDRQDLRITGGAGIQHENEFAARLPETYRGIGDFGLWSDKARFGVDKVPRYEPNPVRRGE